MNVARPFMSAYALAIWLRRVCLLALVAFVVLFDAPVSARIVVISSALVTGGITIGLVLARRARWLWWGYGAYLAGVAVAAAASRAIGTGTALAEQVCFVLLVWSVADEASDEGGGAGVAPWTAAIVTVLALILPQLAGPRSVFDYGRPYHYRALQQWSGYPELGVLCLLGASATWAMFLIVRERAFKAALLVLTGAFAVGIVFLQSRSALPVLGVVAAWAASVVAYRWRSLLAVAALAAGVVAVVGVVWRYPDLTRRFVTASALTVEQDRPVGMREEIWAGAWALVRAHPWVGVGPGQFQRAYARTGAPGTPAHAHNLPLHVAAELGLITMACYLLLWGRVLVSTFRSAGPSTRGAAIWAVHAMLLAFFLRNLVDHFLGGLDTSVRMLAVVAFLFGLAESLTAVATRVPVAEPPSPA